MVSSTIINAIHHKTYRQDGRVAKRRWYKKPVTSVPLVQDPLLSFCWQPKQSIVLSFWKLAHSIYYHNPCYWSQNIQAGWLSGMRRWLTGTSHFGGVDSSITPVILMKFLLKVLFPLFWTPANGIFYPNPCYWSHNIQAEWLSGLCRRPKASVTSVAWVQDQFPSFMLTSYTKYCFPYFQ